MTRDEIRDLVSDTKDITINGKPAIIGGFKLDFMWVSTLDGSYRSEYSDAVIIRALTTKKGKFKF